MSKSETAADPDLELDEDVPELAPRPPRPEEPELERTVAEAMKPKLGSREHTADLYRKLWRTQGLEAVSEIQDERELFQYALGCPANQRHLGIFFTCNPIGKDIDSTMWWSVQKELDERWPADEPVTCGQCYAEKGNDLCQLPITPIGKDRNGLVFRLQPNFHCFVNKIDRKSFEERGEINGGPLRGPWEK